MMYQVVDQPKHVPATNTGPCSVHGRAHWQEIVDNVGTCKCGFVQHYSSVAGLGAVYEHLRIRATKRVSRTTATLRAMEVGMVREIEHSDGVCSGIPASGTDPRRCSVLTMARRMDQHAPWWFRVHHTAQYIATVWKVKGVRPKPVPFKKVEHGPTQP